MPTDRRARSVAVVAVLFLSVVSPLGAQPGADAQDQAEPPAPPSLVVRLFGAIEWAATDRKDMPNSFTLGQIDLFVTGALTEQTTLLAEVVVEESTGTRAVVDLERLQLTYRLNDYLQVSAGRYHTGIGFYNAEFHHGALFETAIGRPRIFAFEDEGGILPVHSVGIMALGAVPGTRSSLQYLVELGNGRSYGPPDAEPEPRDDNEAKAVNAGMAYRPGWRGLELGGSFYRDVLARVGSTSVDHRIQAAYVAHRTPSTEILAEWLRLTHQPRGGARYINDAGYVQLSRAWGALRPYYRYDHAVLDPTTPLIGGAGSYRAQIAGFRLDPKPAIGFKAQYERANQSGVGRIDAVRTQLVFVF